MQARRPHSRQLGLPVGADHRIAAGEPQIVEERPDVQAGAPDDDRRDTAIVELTERGKKSRVEASSYYDAIGIAVEEVLSAGTQTTADVMEVFPPRKPFAAYSVRWESGGALVRHHQG